MSERRLVERAAVRHLGGGGRPGKCQRRVLSRRLVPVRRRSSASEGTSSVCIGCERCTALPSGNSRSQPVATPGRYVLMRMSHLWWGRRGGGVSRSPPTPGAVALGRPGGRCLRRRGEVAPPLLPVHPGADRRVVPLHPRQRPLRVRPHPRQHRHVPRHVPQLRGEVREGSGEGRHRPGARRRWCGASAPALLPSGVPRVRSEDEKRYSALCLETGVALASLHSAYPSMGRST